MKINHVLELNYIPKNTVKDRTDPLFSTMFSQYVEKKLSEVNLYESKCSKKLSQLEENMEPVYGLEEKYCSLCGSMIDEKGNCPLCIIPIFISGAQVSHSQYVSQPDESHTKSEGETAVLPKTRKIRIKAR